ncbi:MAG: phosphate-starvation-inducible PsiE family protein, partial [Gammaproteobacteria bacterium]
MRIGDPLQQMREAWPALTVYERFEHVVSLVVGLLISLLIVVALVHLCIKVVSLIVLDIVDPTQQEVFQALFGMVMT